MYATEIVVVRKRTTKGELLAEYCQRKKHRLLNLNFKNFLRTGLQILKTEMELSLKNFWKKLTYFQKRKILWRKTL